MCDMKLLNSIALLNYIRKMVYQTTKMCVCLCERERVELERKKQEWRGEEEEANLFLLLHSLSATELGTKTSVRKPSIRAS